MKSLSLALVALSSLGSLCTAQFIPGVTATSGMGTFSTYNIANLTNGVGLSSLSVTATHSVTWQDMWITNAITTGWLEFDLGGIQPVSVIAVWNYNSSISLQRGVQQMNVSTSLDHITYAPLSTETVPMGTNAPLLPHLIQCSGVAARWVRFDVLSNWGNNYTGLSEVQFVASGGPNVATNTSIGQGCIRRSASFYENFGTAAGFDLANSALSMIPNGTGYLVVPGPAFVPPSAAATVLTLANNAQATVTLASPFPHAGGSTTTLSVCSNGYVAIASGNTTSGTPVVATMLSAPQTAWWAWHDYNPAAVGGGVVKFEQIGGVAFLTWDGVWDNGGTTAANASSFQFQFDTASGAVHLVFQSMSALGTGYLVGYSPGGASADPGNKDLSIAVPASFTIDNVDVSPLSLTGATRPVINATWTLNVGNVPATGVLGVEVFGIADPGIVDLGFLGAPGCGSRATLDLLNVWVVGGPTHSYGLTLPNDPALVNIDVFTQAVVLQPGVNALLGGAITSNGIDGRIGDL